jgi:serine/threonine protein kinase
MELRLGEKFKIIKKIGSGAFGEIYKGKRIHAKEKLCFSILVTQSV